MGFSRKTHLIQPTKQPRKTHLIQPNAENPPHSTNQATTTAARTQKSGRRTNAEMLSPQPRPPPGRTKKVTAARTGPKNSDREKWLGAELETLLKE